MAKNKINKNNKNEHNNFKTKDNKEVIKDRKKNNQKGGGDCCDDVEIELDIGSAFQLLVDIFFWPINMIIKGILLGIRFLLNHWNKNINDLSLILERFVNLIVFFLNGHLRGLNITLEQMKVTLRFQLMVLKYNPFVYFSALTLPFSMELARFFSDTFSINMISNIFADGDWTLLKNFGRATLNLVLGKTIKPKCNIDNYVSKTEMKKHCFEHNLDSCNINVTTIWNITLYLIVILYISAWFNFLKLFYIDGSDFDLVDYTFIKFGIIEDDVVYTLKDLQRDIQEGL